MSHPNAKLSLEERWNLKVKRTEECWVWVGSKDAGGYGMIRVNGHIKMAHRVGYELFVGPIDVGLTLDHQCNNTSCVNPSHMCPMTQRQNVLRSSGIAASNAKKTHCKNGHEFSEENTKNGRRGNGDTFRVCRICTNKQAKIRRLRNG